MSPRYSLAVDLGAESGRVMLSHLVDDLLELREIHRFPTGLFTRGRGLFWDIAAIEREILEGFRAVARLNVPIASISTDAWGVDCVLVDTEGRPVVEPRCYRDPRNAESMIRVLERISADELYAETGVVPAAINTIFQIEAERHENPALFARANGFLMIADYFNYRFSGVPVAEVSAVSTTQLYNPRTRDWSGKIISALGLHPSLFPQMVSSGTPLGPAQGVGAVGGELSSAVVVASCSHDTAAAIAAVPVGSDCSWAYLSSGTWSILGTEYNESCLIDEGLQAGFTHEVGLNGSGQILKNLVGLWIVQECNRSWREAGKNYSYDDLVRMAEAEGPSQAHINIEDPRFLSPGDMPRKMADFCRETDQPTPQSPPQFVRVALESLALSYARVLSQLSALTGRRFDVLHLVGGGSQNNLLNQLTASAAGIPVLAGPSEATTAGNVLVQGIALGQVESAERLRAIVASSFRIRRFQPAGDFSAKARMRFAGFFVETPSGQFV